MNHYPIFVEGLLPGEEAEVKITKVSKSFAYGRLMKVLTSSPDQLEVMNKAYTQTGIMPLQHYLMKSNYDSKKAIRNYLGAYCKNAGSACV